MLYSQTSEDRQISFFRSMLWHVLEGDAQYKQIVDPVIKDTHDLVCGSKNFFQIDRDFYYTITHLADQQREFFGHIDTNNLQSADYEKVYNELNAVNALIFA